MPRDWIKNQHRVCPVPTAAEANEAWRTMLNGWALDAGLPISCARDRDNRSCGDVPRGTGGKF